MGLATPWVSDHLNGTADAIRVLTQGREKTEAQNPVSDRSGKLNPEPGGARQPAAAASDFYLVSRFLLRLLWTAAILAILLQPRISFAADGIEELLRETHWGESSSALFHQFGDEALRLPRALD